MDKRKIMKKTLAPIFFDLSKTDKKYAEVWLSEGAYWAHYILHVVPEHKVESTWDELIFLIPLLKEKANEEWQKIFRIAVHDKSKDMHCGPDGVLVYSEETE